MSSSAMTNTIWTAIKMRLQDAVNSPRNISGKETRKELWNFLRSHRGSTQRKKSKVGKNLLAFSNQSRLKWPAVRCRNRQIYFISLITISVYFRFMSTPLKVLLYSFKRALSCSIANIITLFSRPFTFFLSYKTGRCNSPVRNRVFSTAVKTYIM